VQTVSPLLALSLLLSIAATACAAYRYWDREPEKMQAAVKRLLTSAWRAAKLAYRVVRWPVTLVIAWAVLILAAPLYLAFALVWVLLSKVAGRHATITIKFT
jgi:hypothetical protein